MNIWTEYLDSKDWSFRQAEEYTLGLNYELHMSIVIYRQKD